MKSPTVLKKIIKSVHRRLSGKKTRIPFVLKRDDENCIYIAARIYGGLGDQLVKAAWIHELFRQAPCKISVDIYGAIEMFKFISREYHCGGRIHTKHGFEKNVRAYDLGLRISNMVCPISVNLARISRISQEFGQWVARLYAFETDYKKYNGTDNKFDGAWAKMSAKVMGWDKWSSLGASNIFPFTAVNKFRFSLARNAEFTRQYDLPDRFVTVHTAELLQTGKNQTKSWPLKHWQEFCGLFKARFPEIPLIQIGKSASPVIKGTDRSLLGQTPFEVLMAILASSCLHIDEDSGLVHWRYALDAPSVVLFGPTVAGYSGYQGNANVVSYRCGECFTSLDTWKSDCVLGYSHPECMLAITPKYVLDIVDPILKKLL